MHIIETATRHKPAAIVACFVFTVVPLYYVSWRYRMSIRQSSSGFHSHTPVWSDRFIDEWLDVQLIEPFDPSPLERYCDRMTWHPNLILNLADANGGIGNVRGNFLDFFMYAIEAGASIMLPDRAARNQDDLANVWAGRAAFDTFFDEKWFVSSITKACQQLTVHIPAENTTFETLQGVYLPRSRRAHEEAEHDRNAYVKELDHWLQEAGYKEDKLFMVNYIRSLWQFDTRGLPNGVRRTMGQILRINPTIRRIAAMVVQELAKRFDLQIDPRVPIPRNAFLGAHLRTESDAAKAGWLNAPNTDFSAQTDAYMRHAEAYHLNVMYVASGNASELERFKEKAAQHRPSLNVTSKLELLGPAQMEELNKLTWDQQALVDYEVLQRCSIFIGFVRSSFSYNIAMTRNQWLDDHGLLVDPWLVLHSEEAVAFDDGYSRIIGRDENHETLIPRGMWP